MSKTATLYAHWDPKHTLILDANIPADSNYSFSGFTDGKLTLWLTPAQALILTPSDVADNRGIKSYDYETTGEYYFSHWYVSNESEKVESLAELFENATTATIKAAWAKKYTVTLNANKPSGATLSYTGGTVYLNADQKNALLKDPTTTSFDDTVLLAKADLAQSHYFDHWTYANNVEFSEKDVWSTDTAVTIYAQWTAKKKVTINVSNSANAISAWSVTIGETPKDNPSNGTVYYVLAETTVTVTASNNSAWYIFGTAYSKVTITGLGESTSPSGKVEEISISGKINADTTITINGKW